MEQTLPIDGYLRPIKVDLDETPDRTVPLLALYANGEKHLASALHPGLQLLSLGGFGLSDSALARLARMPRLECLRLEADGPVTFEALVALAKCPRLVSLAINLFSRWRRHDKERDRWEAPSPAGRRPWIAALKRAAALLGGEVHVQGDLAAVVPSPKTLARLRDRVELVDLSPVRKPGSHLEALRGAKTLRYLDLRRTDVGGADVRRLPEFPALVSLNLSECAGLGEKDLERLAALSGLEHLDLTRCGGGTAPATDAVASRLATLDRLRWLDIRRSASRMTDAGLTALAGLARLEHLGFCACGVSKKGLRRLAESESLRSVAACCSSLPGLTGDDDVGIDELRSMVGLKASAPPFGPNTPAVEELLALARSGGLLAPKPGAPPDRLLVIEDLALANELAGTQSTAVQCEDGAIRLIDFPAAQGVPSAAAFTDQMEDARAECGSPGLNRQIDRIEEDLMRFSRQAARKVRGTWADDLPQHIQDTLETAVRWRAARGAGHDEAFGELLARAFLSGLLPCGWASTPKGERLVAYRVPAGSLRGRENSGSPRSRGTC